MTDCLPEIGQVAPMWGRRPYAYPGANLGTGNRCGHNPEQFATDRLALPKVKGGHLPSVLKKAIKRSEEFFADPDVMSRLGYHRNKKRNQDGSFRKIRSELRECVALVQIAILSATDLVSLRIGHWCADGSFRNYTCDELAARVGLACLEKNPEDPENPRMVASSRWWRAFGWIKDSAGLQVFEQYEEKEDGSKRARAAIKTIDEKFLMLLARFPAKALHKARKNAYERLRTFLKRAPKYNIQTEQERSELDNLLGITPTPTRTKRKNQKPTPADATTPMPLHSTDHLKREYQRHVDEVTARIIEAEGSHPGPRLRKLFFEYGGLTHEQFEQQHIRL
ncbi:hypothetical protein [Pseudomonas protegens]|uniref:hypothetical protein n=1 Tax=Pseudomonas protegens TaxID=380021 RepID=UPI001B320158|nr:hypothetical protein [Pseudomonas protegens]